MGRLSSLLRRDRRRDPEVTATINEALRHIRTNRRLLREIRAVQVQLERSSPPFQRGPSWRSTQSSPHSSG